jgi:glycosyltransferase involved in cell wall biosynthesis
MPDPDISVVVPVRNGAATLPALLDALAAQTLSRERFEIVVVDNDSDDDSGRVAGERGARAVAEPLRGRARARNRGVAAARAPAIAFTDADCLPDSRWLEALMRCLERAPLVAGAVELVTGEPPNRWERLERLWRFDQERDVAAGWAASANLGVRREAFEAAGGFDSSYRHIG